MIERTYMAIDLKSFYASVECTECGLDPLNANLVVADESRTSKTICLAVSPALKKFGVSGRPRLYEVEQRVAYLNNRRAKEMSHQRLSPVVSIYRDELLKSPELKIGYRIARPRMNFYLEKSAAIYEIYLRYLPPEKIHVYSIDEVMMDITDYLNEYQVSARSLAKEIIQTIKAETQITATAGIGTNLFLAKVAMDIVAKRIPGDEDARPYNFTETRLVIQEMVNSLALQLTKQNLVTDQVALRVAYDVSNISEDYQGPLVTDFYGRQAPKPMHGKANLSLPTSSGTELMEAFMKLYDSGLDRRLTVRKITVIANHLLSPRLARLANYNEQLDLFTDSTKKHKNRSKVQEKDQKLQRLVLDLQNEYGKNAIIRAADLKKGATLLERNNQIGGHQA